MFQNYWPTAQLGPLHNQVCHMNLRLWFISRHTYVVVFVPCSVIFFFYHLIMYHCQIWSNLWWAASMQAIGSAFTFSWTSLTWLFKEAKWPNLDPQSKHVFSLECFSLTWLFNFVFEMNFFSHCLHAKTSLLWTGRWEMSCLLISNPWPHWSQK